VLNFGFSVNAACIINPMYMITLYIVLIIYMVSESFNISTEACHAYILCSATLNYYIIESLVPYRVA